MKDGSRRRPVAGSSDGDAADTGGRPAAAVDGAHDAPEKLAGLFRSLGSVCVAFSGGVDSSVLLAVAADVLGRDHVVGVTASSPLWGDDELAAARALAGGLGVRHATIEVDLLGDERITANSPERCYHCKSAVLDGVLAMAAEHGCASVVDGAHRDDLHDHRPGLQAAEERGVRHPLIEAGMGKTDVRKVARGLGLDVWDRPPNACLATRVPYGEPLTGEKLSKVAAAEAVLRRLGFLECRVRHHGTVARVEVPAADLEGVLALRESVVAGIRDAGFVYVVLDLAGFRSGSLNEVLGRSGKID